MPNTPPAATRTEQASNTLLDPPSTNASAVVGLQWGDEGKGKIIDILAQHHDAVVRFNGGANAGHSIVVKGERYAVHLLPSGVFRDNTESVIANGVVADVAKLAQEITSLRERGVNVPLGNEDPGSGLWLSSRAHIVTPFHKAQDKFTEQWLEQHHSADPIGTTGRGIGPAYADKANRTFALRAADLLRPDHLRSKLRLIAEWKLPQLAAIATPENPLDRERLDPDHIADELLLITQTLAPAITDTTALLRQRLEQHKRILFEGANATLLDVDHGTYPFVTSSNTAAAGIATGTGLPPAAVPRPIGVCKAYCTRVGQGPFPTELHDDTAQRIRTRGNEFGTTTGRPRRVGWLDLVALRYAAQINGVASIAVMLLDVLATEQTLRLCTHYKREDGSTTEHFLPDAADLAGITPVFQDLPGFTQDITAATSLADLPDNARRYLDTIEAAVGVPISIVSVGPDREQTINA